MPLSVTLWLYNTTDYTTLMNARGENTKQTWSYGYCLSITTCHWSVAVAPHEKHLKNHLYFGCWFFVFLCNNMSNGIELRRAHAKLNRDNVTFCFYSRNFPSGKLKWKRKWWSDRVLSNRVRISKWNRIQSHHVISQITIYFSNYK